MIATGDTGVEVDEAVATVRGQLAFYGSTPACARVLECIGWEGLHPRLNALSNEGRRDEIAPLIRAKVAGVADPVSLECTRRSDPRHFGDICRALQAAPDPG